MKKIKSIILNTDFPSIKKKINFFNTTKNKTRTLPNKASIGFKHKYLIKKNISFFKKSPFPSTKNNLELINFYLNENKKQSKKDRLYRTEIQTSQRIIKFPSSNINKRNNNYIFDKKYITSYSSSRKNNLNNNNLKNADTGNIIGNILESQFFINLNLLLGKRKSVNKIENEKYQLNSMKLRKEYENFILKKSLLNYKSAHDTPFAHNLNTIFLLKEYQKIKLDPQKERKNIKSNLYKLENFRKYEIEKKDSINPEYLNYLKIERKLRKIVFNSNEIKYKNFTFFNKYENKINYIYDMCHVPYFKNRLLKYNNEINKETKYINELDSYNFIEHKVFDFVNLKKIKIQELKDKGINNIILDDFKNNINNQNINLNNNSKIKNYNFNQDDNDINKDEIEINNENKLKNKKKLKLKLKMEEELEDFFITKNFIKYNPYIASEELKNLIYKKFNKSL